MGCILHISGENLDLDQALAAVTFVPYQPYRKGDPIKRRPGEFRKDSGFKADVSNADFHELPKQFAEAESFLQKHFNELLSLEGVEYCNLDFGYNCRLYTGENSGMITVQCDDIPASLIRLCGALSIGISLTLFPSDENPAGPHRGIY